MFEDIVTERLILRDLRAGDAEFLVQYRAAPEVARYQSWQPESVAKLLVFFEELRGADPDAARGWYQIAIGLRPGGELIGDCGIHTFEDRRLAEIGITVAPRFQRRGYASEALRALMGYLFGTLGKHRVSASVDPRNAESMRLMQRVGFRQEGRLIESQWCRGEWADEVTFAMLAREWELRQRS